MSYSLIAQRIVHKHYTTRDHLPHDITYQIIQDNDGFIWIGTDDGLSKFDGSNFTNFSYEHGLTSNYVIDVIENNKHGYLIATWGGGLHHLKNDSVYKLPFNDNEGKLSKLYPINDSVVYAHNINTLKRYNLKSKKNTSIYVYANEKTVTIPRLSLTKPNRDCTAFNYAIENIDSTLYFFNKENPINNLKPILGLYKLVDHKLTPYLWDYFNDKQVHGITKDREGKSYVSSFNTVTIFQKDKFIKQHTIPLPNHKIFNVKVHGDQLYFIAINIEDNSRKMFVYDLRSKQLKNVSEALKIKSLISDFLIDRDQGIWISTYGQGVFYIPPIEHSFFGDEFFSNADIKDLIVMNNQLFVLSTNAIYAITNDTIIEEKKLPIHSEHLHLNNTKDTLALISHNTAPNHISLNWNYPLKSYDYKDYRFTKGNTTIVFKNENVLVYKNDTLASHTITYKKVSYIRHVATHEDKIYVIYDRLGVYVFNRSSGKLEAIWNKKNGYHTNQYRDIAFQNDTIWLASDIGVFKMQSGKLLKRYTTQDGLLSNHINDLLIDRHGILWAANQKGLSVFHKNSFYTIGNSQGQESTFITKLLSYNQSIYAAGNNGLFKYINTTAFKPKPCTTLKVQQKHGQFSIATLNFINPNSVKIQYQLNSDQWTELQQHTINFDHLKEGEYQLQFRYKDNINPWAYTNHYHFNISLPWYEQLWFYLGLISLIFIGIIYIIFKRLEVSRKKNIIFQNTIKEREELQKELRNVRQQIAQDFHDDLGNKLASISIASNLLLQKNETSTLTKSKLKLIKKESDALYHGMRDFVWSLNYKNNKLSELQSYLSDFGEELYADTSIVFKSDHNIPNTNTELPYYWSKQLVLLFKEAMTNALKHSQGTEVKFDIIVSDSLLTIKLVDNGLGISLNEDHRINGIQNMQDRAKSINGALNINSNQGTSILFTAPLKQ